MVSWVGFFFPLLMSLKYNEVNEIQPLKRYSLQYRDKIVHLKLETRIPKLMSENIITLCGSISDYRVTCSAAEIISPPFTL